MTVWKPGDRLRHRFNLELGPGRVVEIDGRSLVVEFPQMATTLRLASSTDALVPLPIVPGARACLAPAGESVLVQGVLDGDRVELADGRIVTAGDLWPADVSDSPVDLLAQGEVGSVEAFSLVLDALHLRAIREAHGLGSFLGGRIRIFPHQLHVALRATRTDPVRWLLADEVGLGKTVEACLILQHLVQVRRAERALVVAPRTLALQWLGELWRKYHQVFVLLDERRLQDVERDFGRHFNPFETHRRAVISLELLVSQPRLTEQAVEAGIDLLVVDEAHHLRRPEGHPGNPAYRAIRPIADLGRHVLLLTATPLEEDAHGFFRLLQLLRPAELSEALPFRDSLAKGELLPPCTSSTRRADIGGLPPRVAKPVDIDPEGEGWLDHEVLERELRALPADNAVVRREKAEKIRRGLSSGASVLPVLDEKLRSLARKALASDPRIAHLAAAAPAWKERGEKTLVFVAERETLEAVRGALSRWAQVRAGVFHEDLPSGEGDIEVAQFRLPQGPSILISTEAGGEGRNFEFCHRLVLFDMPWSPEVLEQRIGRLDRIGRRIPVEIVYYRPPGGIGAALVRLHESLGLFREPFRSRQCLPAAIEEAVREAALSDQVPLPREHFDALVASAREARDGAREAAYAELHRDRYREDLAPGILARIPEDLDELTEDVVLGASGELGLAIEEHREGKRHSIELGAGATVDSLPGVPGGATFLGTFRRVEAVEDESIDYFASGHPLVEGILAEIEDGPLGRTAILHVDLPGEEGFGLLALYRDGPRFIAVAVDAAGRQRPDWAAILSTRPLKTRRVKPEALVRQAGWPETIRRLAVALGRTDRPIAVAALLVEGISGTRRAP